MFDEENQAAKATSSRVQAGESFHPMKSESPPLGGQGGMNVTTNAPQSPFRGGLQNLTSHTG